MSRAGRMPSAMVAVLAMGAVIAASGGCLAGGLGHPQAAFKLGQGNAINAAGTSRGTTASIVYRDHGGILTRTACRKCGGHFVVHAHDLHDRFVCGLCDVPSCAGKTRDASASGRSTAAAGVEPSLH